MDRGLVRRMALAGAKPRLLMPRRGPI